MVCKTDRKRAGRMDCELVDGKVAKMVEMSEGLKAYFEAAV